VRKTSVGKLNRLLRDFFEYPVGRLGVAVSGGGDSVALLCLLSDWSACGGPEIEAVTVDHGLRPDSAREARFVAMLCTQLNIPHTTLIWDGPDASGNLQDQARRARYQMMADWAEGRGIVDIALGHTTDDVAEGFLMRLARGSGLDGLSAMSDSVEFFKPVRFVRPLLGASRDELRAYLKGRGQVWTDDPSNLDDRFERARIRKALDVLNDLGITPGKISRTSERLRDAREDLTSYVSDFAREAVQFDAGDLVLAIDRDGAGPGGRLVTKSAETFRRILRAGVMWISGSEYAPRSDSLDQLIAAEHARTSATVGGCRAVFHRGTMRLTREWKAVAETRCEAGETWDGRWLLTGPEDGGLEIAALGEAGLERCSNRKATGRPAASLIAGPAVWRHGEVIAAPLAGLSNGWSAKLIRNEESYFSLL